MFKELLLDQDQQKIELYTAILDTAENEIPTKDLQETLNISSFLLNKTIKLLNADLESIKSSSSIVLSSGILYTTYNFSREIQQILLSNYFKNSPFSILINQLIVSGKEGLTFNYFEIEYFWSRYQFFSYKHKLLEFLENNITNNNETSYRYLLFSILRYYNVQLELPPHLTPQLQVLEMRYNPEKSINKNKVLSLMLGITYYENQHDSKEITLDELWIENISNDKMPLSEKYSHCENILFTQFLILEGIISDHELENIKFSDSDKESIIYRTLSQFLIPLFTKSNNNISLIKKELNLIAKTILAHICGPNYIETSRPIIPEQFFKELYPSLIKSLSRVFEQLDQNNIRVTNQNNIYLLICSKLLSSDLNFTDIDSVSICVDFSNGQSMNKWIIQQIQTYTHPHTNINITTFDKNVDLYLSDYRIDNYHNPQIIWTKPPTPNDWYIFGKYIIAIKQKHLQ